MFEGLVASLLNKYLGRYIQNLDAENLNISILSGNVELTDLELRPEALFELDLPIEVKSGYVGSIKLVIPWSALYTLPVIVTVQDVYILTGPVTDRPYDQEKEGARHSAHKRKQLEQLDQLYKSSKEEKESEDEGFLEKLTATIVNNIQIHIESIHVRYEDTITKPGSPFAFGITLENIAAETANSNWVVSQIDSRAPSIHKLITLRALGVYWDTNLKKNELVRSKLDTSTWKELLRSSISSQRIYDEEFQYVIPPVSAYTKLTFNKEEQIVLPKLTVDFTCREIAFDVSRQQYLEILVLVKSMQQMKVEDRYRKYRPVVPIAGNSKVWWKFAYRSVIEDRIRPFSWSAILKYNKAKRQYRDLYKKKLEHPKDTDIVLALDKLETGDVLDVTAIMLSRLQAKQELAKQIPERIRKKKEKSWFWGWFSASSDSEDELEIPDHNKDWLSKLSGVEREQLFKGIGYDESSKLQKGYKKSIQYVEHKINFNLSKATVTLLSSDKTVLEMVAEDMFLTFDNRPDHSAFRVSSHTKTFGLKGASVESKLVSLVTSNLGVGLNKEPRREDDYLFNVVFDQRPYDVKADFSLDLKVLPVEIVYDENAISQVIKFFQTPTIKMKDVTEVASKRLYEIAQYSKANVIYAIENHKMVHVSVDVRSPYIIIPEHGSLHTVGNVLVVDLGALTIRSKLQANQDQSLENSTLNELESKLYDQFNLSLTQVKVLLADSGADWPSAQMKDDSIFHILPSTGLDMVLFNSVISSFKQLPRQKMKVSLPSLKLSISDDRAVELVKFVNNIPLPSIGSTDTVDGFLREITLDSKDVKKNPTMTELKCMKRQVCKANRRLHQPPPNDVSDSHREPIEPSRKPILEMSTKKKSSKKTEDEDTFYSASDHSDEDVSQWARSFEVATVDDTGSIHNCVTMLLHVEVPEVVITIKRAKDNAQDYLMLHISHLNGDFAVTEYGFVAQAGMSSLKLVDKLNTGSSGQYVELFSYKSSNNIYDLIYRKVNADCPDFTGYYGGTEDAVLINFSRLAVVVDRPAVLYLKNYIERFISRITDSSVRQQSQPKELSLAPQDRSMSRQTIRDSVLPTDDLKAGVIALQVVAKLNEVIIQLKSHEVVLANVTVKGIESRCVIRRSRTVLSVRLLDFLLENGNPNALYSKLVYIEDDNVFDAKVTLYNKPKEGAVDSNIRVRIGQMHAVLLYMFIDDVIAFIEPFISRDITTHATTVAMEAVTREVIDIREKGRRLLFNIDIKAPSIAVPESSQNRNMLVAKLGNLTIRNFFGTIQLPDGQKQDTDTFSLKMESIKVERCMLIAGSKISTFHTVIEPIMFHVDFVRAIQPVRSDTRYTVSASLNVIHIHLDQSDVKLLFRIINHNLGEGKTRKLDQTDLIVPVEANTVESGTTADIHSKDVQKSPLKEATIKLLFEGMILELMRQESNISETSERLSLFRMGSVQSDITIYSDQQISVEVSLDDITLDDVRHDGQLANKKMILPKYKVKHNTGSQRMLKVKYKQLPDGNSSLDLEMESVRLNVSVPYYLEVIKFFTESMSSTSQAKATSVTTTKKKTVADPDSNAVFTITGQVKEPEIVLFADPTSKNSRVLLMRTDVKFSQTFQGVKQNLTISADDLKIMTCMFGREDKTASMVLFPCNIEFSRIQETADVYKMYTKLPDIELHMSSNVIHILMDVINEYNQGMQVKSTKSESEVEISSDEDLWSVKEANMTKWDNFVDNTEEEAFIPDADEEVTESIEVFAEKMVVIFQVENLDDHFHVLYLETFLEGKVENWTKTLGIEAELHLEISYFNEKNDVWEPLIEPVMEREGHYRPWEVLFKLKRAPSRPINSTCEVDSPVSVYDQVDSQDGMSRAQSIDTTDSEDTKEADTDTGMTVLKRRKFARMMSSRALHSSESTDMAASSPARKDSTQEDKHSDSLLHSFTSKLAKIFTDEKDSMSEVNLLHDAEIDDENESSVPVFLTSKGPVEFKATDEVDCAIRASEETKTCSYIFVSSQDQLLLNCTPQAMLVIKNVTEAVTKQPDAVLRRIMDKPALEIYNELGIPTTVSLPEEVKVHKDYLHHCNSLKAEQTDGSRLSTVSSDSVDNDDVDGLGLGRIGKALEKLATVKSAILKKRTLSESVDVPDIVDSQVLKNHLTLQVDGFHPLDNLPCRKTTKAVVTLKDIEDGIPFEAIYEVDITNGRKIIKVKSPLQFHNRMFTSLDVLCKTEAAAKHGVDVKLYESDGDYVILSCVESGQIYSLPLVIAYKCPFYIRPTKSGYQTCHDSIWWNDITTKKDHFLSCLPQTGDGAYYIKIVMEHGDRSVLTGSMSPESPYISISAYPPLVVHNYLPYDVSCSHESNKEKLVVKGGSEAFHSSDLITSQNINMKLGEYENLQWSGVFKASEDMDDCTTVTMATQNNAEDSHLCLSVHANKVKSLDVYIHASYWIVNKTGLSVQLKESGGDAVCFLDTVPDKPILFSYKKHKRKKCKLKLGNTDWSKSFSLDAVGSSGVVIVRDKVTKQKYQMLIQIQMSYLKLTKLVTLMPYFLVVNNSTHQLSYAEENGDQQWFNIEPSEVQVFWPKTEDMKITTTYRDSSNQSQHVSFKKLLSSVLRMDKGTAISTEVSGGMETPRILTFKGYEAGAAPVRVDNFCDDVIIKINQKGQSQTSLLSSKQGILYTWDDPTLERALVWNVYHGKRPNNTAHISKDGFGFIKINLGKQIDSSSAGRDLANVDGEPSEHTSLLKKNKTKAEKVVVYWVSYLDGLQRVLLFTQDDRIAKCAKQATEYEYADTAFYVSLDGIGVSLVNSMYREVAFMSVSGAPSVWSVQVNKKWKKLDMDIAAWLEYQYKNNQGHVNEQDVIEADFNTLTMKKPFWGPLQRCARPGIWVQYRGSQHLTSFSGRVHRLQLDNQMSDAYFPSVFYPTMICDDSKKQTAIHCRPFIELSLLRRQVPEYRIDTVRYFKVLVQEFDVKIDKGFILSAYDVFTPLWKTESDDKMLEADIQISKRSLKEVSDIQEGDSSQKIIFEYFHLSPLMLHVSFSLEGTAHVSAPRHDSVTSDIVSFFLNSVGVTLTEIKDVELRMAYFERTGEILTLNQLLNQVRSHYTQQAIQQAYVLILGLDVLGNPYGLVKDFTKGFGDFFYKPILGTIDNPDRFGENFIEGIESLMGNTVGSLAGSVSLISGSLGRALAFLSFDDNYKRKRKLRMQQHPNLPKTFAMGAQSLIMGIGLGIGGIVISPVKGAREDSVEGFFKGLGKGFMGLLTKPVGGVVDMLSISFDGIKRAIESGSHITARVRLPRFINQYEGLKPYAPYAALGYRLLLLVSQGQYANSDIYWAHAALGDEKNADILLITDRHIMFLEKSRFWGEWQTEWVIDNGELSSDPKVTNNTLVLSATQDGSTEVYEVKCDQSDVLIWLVRKINLVMKWRQQVKKY